MSIRRLIIGFAIAAPFLAIALFSRSPWLALGILFVSHMLLLYPTLTPNTQWFGSVITDFPTTENEVWLTIDDGPDDDIDEMLAVLKKFNAQATFFLVGEKIAKHPDRASSILKSAHTIENHTFTHPSATFWCLGPQSIHRELEKCSATIEETCGKQPRYFRAVAGMKNMFVHPALKKLDMQLVGWTVRGFDAVNPNAQKVASAIMAKVRPGAIIVLHQGRKASDTQSSSVDCLEALLIELRETGYRCVVPKL